MGGGNKEVQGVGRMRLKQKEKVRWKEEARREGKVRRSYSGVLDFSHCKGIHTSNSSGSDSDLNFVIVAIIRVRDNQ